MGEKRIHRLTDEEIDGWWDIITAGHSTFGLTSEKRYTYSMRALEKLVKSYNENASKERAVVKLNHAARSEADSHGMVAELRVVENRLQARLEKLSPWLRRALKIGFCRDRSIEAKIGKGDEVRLLAVSFLEGMLPNDKALSPYPNRR